MTTIWLTSWIDNGHHCTEHPTIEAARTWADNQNRGRLGDNCVWFSIEWPPVLPGWSKREEAA